jgi:putative component of membrane protein insertase Oxa1/YidC/SpoIIIJ protein YidD
MGDSLSSQDSAFINLCIFFKKQPVDSIRSDRLPLIPPNVTSELSLATQATIWLYQEFISSQQHNVCVFGPSCSHFGQESIREFGLVKGVLLTADRLQRCNNFATHYEYEFDRLSGRLLDPVETYRNPEKKVDSIPAAPFAGNVQ